MSRKVCKMKQGLLLLCCMIAATGCKQAPPAQMETEYEVMTVVPADRMISSAYSATIRGRQDIDIYPQVSGTLTKVSSVLFILGTLKPIFSEKVLFLYPK